MPHSTDFVTYKYLFAFLDEAMQQNPCAAEKAGNHTFKSNLFYTLVPTPKTKLYSYLHNSMPE